MKNYLVKVIGKHTGSHLQYMIGISSFQRFFPPGKQLPQIKQHHGDKMELIFSLYDLMQYPEPDVIALEKQRPYKSLPKIGKFGSADNDMIFNVIINSSKNSRIFVTESIRKSRILSFSAPLSTARLDLQFLELKILDRRLFLHHVADTLLYYTTTHLSARYNVQGIRIRSISFAYFAVLDLAVLRAIFADQIRNCGGIRVLYSRRYY